MRTSKPQAGNKFYTTKARGGYSTCIQGKPADVCNVLANCVGYACGRFNEIIGSMKYPDLNCNAESFIERAKNVYGLQVVPYPTLGGIMVWAKGQAGVSSDGAGHVAIVEKIIDKNRVYTSESGYGSKTAFWNATRSNSNGRWGMGSGYWFRGCIVNPAIGDVHYVDPTPAPTPTPTPTKSVDEVAREVIAGKWDNYPKRKQLLEEAGYNYSEVQARVNEILAGDTPAPTPQPKVDILDLVRRTIRGDFGNGADRRNALGENYNEVQRQVNLNYQNGTTRWDNVRLY